MHALLTLGLALFLLPQDATEAKSQPKDEVGYSKRTITFPSWDKLDMTADLYLAHREKRTPFIVLFHQAGWSRGEYKEIAPRLCKLGYNCLAVDLRSGGSVNGVDNETFKRASKAGKRTTYSDALPDIVSALEYADETFSHGPLVAWGSSYSSSLALKIAGDRPKLVDGVLAFAPGEYFTALGKPESYIRDAARMIECPSFVTSARAEKSSWSPIFAAIDTEEKLFYLPETDGQHGSRALWSKFPEHAGYWKAVEGFLGKYFPPMLEEPVEEPEEESR